MTRSASILSLALLAGCCCPIDLGNKTKTPLAAPAPSVGGAPATPTTPKPGHASGRILGPDGKPFTLKDAKVKLSVNGVSGRGENVGFSPPIDEQGAWDIELPPGHFSAHATMECDWKGRRYIFTLHPMQDNTVSRPSAAGFVQDFQWRIQGVTFGSTEDQTNHTHWYGSTLGMCFQGYREDQKKSVKKPPFGTKVVFTLTPTGPLIDGSTGKTLTFERPYDKLLTGLTNNNCCDIPIGTYRLTGVEVGPDGKTTPLSIQKEYAVFVDALDLTIEEGRYGIPSCRILGFTRNAD